MLWTDSEQLPNNIRDNLTRSGRFGLIARLEGLGSSDRLGRLLRTADRRVVLESEGRASLEVELDPGCRWFQQGMAWVYLPIGLEARRGLVAAASYRAIPRNGSALLHWKIARDVVSGRN